MPTAAVILQLQNQAGASIASAASQVGALAAAEQRAALQILQRQNAAARLLTTTQQLALVDQRTATEAARTALADQRAALAAAQRQRAEASLVTITSQAALVDQRSATEAARTAAAQDRAAVAALRRADAERRSAQASQRSDGALPRTFAGFTSQGLSEIKSQLLGFAGPAAAATIALNGVKSALDFTEQGFELKARLDQTNAAITYQIAKLRDAGSANAEAQAFADRYKLTQEDLTAALQASIPVLRQTKASTTDVLTTFARLQATAPEQPISEAARAIRELATGDVTSIKELFNIPAKDALAMKNAIAAGQDPIKVVSDYLDKAGVDSTLLAKSTEGAAGKMKELRKETEQLQLALGGQSGGAGEFILDEKIKVARALTRLLTGDVDELRGSLRESFNGGDTFSNWLSGAAGARAIIQALGGDIQALGLGTKGGTSGGTEWGQQIGSAFTAAAAGAQDAQARLDAYNRTIQLTGALSADDIQKKQQQQAASDRLSQFNKDLAAAAVRVASGMSTQEQEASALAAKYPELRGQIGVIISGQLQLASTVDAANQKLREQQLIAAKGQIRELSNQGSLVGAPGTKGNDVGDYLAFVDAQKRAEEARRNQILQTGTQTQVVAERQREYNEAVKQFGATSAEAIDAETRLKEARAAGSKGRVDKAATTALQLQDIERNSAAEIERIQRESNERLADMQEDFRNRQSDNEEDFQRRYRKLLAEGKRFEAQQAREEFERQRARDTRDEQIRERRQQRDTAEQLGDQGGRVDRRTDSVAARAALRGVKAGALPPSPGGPGGVAGGATAGGGEAVAATGGGTRVIQVPIKFVINGREFAVQLMDAGLRQLIDDDLVLELEAAGLNPPDVARRATQGAGS